MLVFCNVFEVSPHHFTQSMTHQKGLLVFEPFLHVFLRNGCQLFLFRLDNLTLLLQLILGLRERPRPCDAQVLHHLSELVFAQLGLPPTLLL